SGAAIRPMAAGSAISGTEARTARIYSRNDGARTDVPTYAATSLPDRGGGTTEIARIEKTIAATSVTSRTATDATATVETIARAAEAAVDSSNSSSRSESATIAVVEFMKDGPSTWRSTIRTGPSSRE
ncbi:MAG: hypothetical protein WED81_00840, partial [Rhodothermales bacterium]